MPLAQNLHVRLIHQPRPAHWLPVPADLLRQRWSELLDPAEDRPPADIYATVGQDANLVLNFNELVSLGSGKITINGRSLENYFTSPTHRMILTEPLRATERLENYDVDCTMHGGGITGQAGALRLGIARALAELDPEQRVALKRAGFLTRDAREKESKKYGLKKARKAPQYSKR